MQWFVSRKGDEPTYTRERSDLEVYLEREAERLRSEYYHISHVLLGHAQLRELCRSYAYVPYLDPRLFLGEKRKGRDTVAVGLWGSIEVWLADDVSIVQFVTKQDVSTGKTHRL